VSVKGDEDELLRSLRCRMRAASSRTPARRAPPRGLPAEAQKLSHTGSFGWTVSTGEINGRTKPIESSSARVSLPVRV